MKFEINFSGLDRALMNMGAQERSFELEVCASTEQIWDGLDLELNKGIALKDIKPKQDKILYFKNERVMLYIPDHSFNFEQTVHDPSVGKKVHFAECATITSMRNQGFGERYTVTKKTTGLFNIYRSSQYSMRDKADKQVKLFPCKNCLKETQYDNFSNKPYNERKRYLRAFNYKKLLEKYSPSFSQLPTEKTAEDCAYPKNWKQISHKVKQSAGYTCEACKVNLSRYQHLLNAHHIDRIKSNNASDNLLCLCVECHAKQPAHQHIKIKYLQIKQLEELRIKQYL